ncbi:MAG: hypothetical protein JWM57_3000 [Phycisphaerales bacterium]|nr:hypothetical protein [Phycisphaerales bacterium]
MSQIPPTAMNVTRRFTYTHPGQPEITFGVHLTQVLPALIASGLREHTHETDQLTVGAAILSLCDIAVQAIKRFEGLKLRHLRVLARLSPDDVARLGLLDDLLPAARDVIPDYVLAMVAEKKISCEEAKTQTREMFENNARGMLLTSPEFLDFVFNVITGEANFRDAAVG